MQGLSRIFRWHQASLPPGWKPHSKPLIAGRKSLRIRGKPCFLTRSPAGPDECLFRHLIDRPVATSAIKPEDIGSMSARRVDYEACADCLRWAKSRPLVHGRTQNSRNTCIPRVIKVGHWCIKPHEKRQKSRLSKPFECDREGKVVHWYIGVPRTHVTREFCGQEKSAIGT